MALDTDPWAVAGLVTAHSPPARPEPDLIDRPPVRPAIPTLEPASSRRRWYLPLLGKFVISASAAALWAVLSVWLSLPWLHQLERAVGSAVAVVVIAFIAWIPGWLIAFLMASLMLDRQPTLRMVAPTDAVTVIVAARNESRGIADTLERIAKQDHAGPITVLVADNGSTDGTAAVAKAAAVRLGLDLAVVREDRPGKSHALNTALAVVATPLVITVDADTALHHTAVRQLVARLGSGPEDVQAVAGAVLVRNSRQSVWTSMQEWDYFLGISSIKRMQGMYQGTLVAQGAFSLYRTEALRAVGGWPDAIGEDIVVTWQLMARGGRVYFEPLAVAFTDVPPTLRDLARQRSRWARGMIEGLRTVPPWRQPHGTTRVITSLDLLIPLLDLTYTFVWLPGLLLACFGIFWIVGPYTLFVLPLTLVVNWILYRHQRRRVFEPMGLRVRSNWFGFLLYVLAYQMLMSPVAVIGYFQELLRLRRRWR
jgi:biofilm PGA synthesis N-glycosyltransferase PgaC